MPAIVVLLYVGGICLTFLGCSPNLEPVVPVDEPSLPTRIAAVPSVDQPELEDLPDADWGVPGDLVDENGKPPFGWLFWVLAWPILWLTMAFLRYCVGRRKIRKGDNDNGTGMGSTDGGPREESI